MGGSFAELGGSRELAPGARVLGDLVFVGVLVLTAALERLQLSLKGAESSRWWASNGRDVLNLFAFASMAFGLRIVGFTGPIALATAATMVIAISVIESSLARFPRTATALSMGAAVALGLP